MIYLWVNKRPWRHPGPIVNVGVRNAHSLAAAGHETHLCLPRGAASDTHLDLATFYGLERHDLLHVHRVPPFLPFFGSGIPVFLYAFSLALRLARRDRVTVISRDAGFLPFLARLATRPRVTALYESHDFHADPAWRGTRQGWPEKRETWLENEFLPRITGLVCITEPQRRLYAGLFPSLPSLALPLGCDPAPPVDPELLRRRAAVAYVGHLHGWKGLGTLIRSSHRLHRKFGIRTVVLGGSDAQVQRFRALADATQAGEGLRLQGFLPPAEMHRILGGESSAGVVMLRDTFYNRNLTCPAKALDYLAHGLPIIASDLPSLRELLGPAAIYVPIANANRAYRRAVRTLFADPPAFAATATAAAARSRELSWPNRARALHDFAQSLASPQPQSP